MIFVVNRMNDLCKSFIEKISSYNLFNNLYPGIIFCCILKYLLNVDILLDEWYENAFLFYFCGSVISRFGSLVIESILCIKLKIFRTKKSWSFLKRASYEEYLFASSEDKLLVTLSETNNTYRTLLSVSVCSLITKLFIETNNFLISKNIYFLENNIDLIILIGLTLLYLFSFKKQTKYIKDRVEIYKNKISFISK